MMITRQVIVTITIVSMNGSTRPTTPSETGSSVFAAAWAIGAEPCPASLENSPRLTPQFRVTSKAPIPVPATPADGVNASLRMSPKVGRTSPRFIRMTSRAPNT